MNAVPVPVIAFLNLRRYQSSWAKCLLWTSLFMTTLALVVVTAADRLLFVSSALSDGFARL